MLLHHHTVSLCYLFSSCVSCSPSCGSLVQFLCSRILSSFLKLYFVFRFILHLFPKSCSAGPKLLAWIITHSFPPSVSTTCFRYFAFPYQQFIFPQISTSVLSQPFSSIQHLVLFLSWPSITPVLFLELASTKHFSEYILSSLIYFSSFYFAPGNNLLILPSVSRLKDNTNLWNQGPGSISHFFGTVFSQTTSAREQEQLPKKSWARNTRMPSTSGQRSHQPQPSPTVLKQGQTQRL